MQECAACPVRGATGPSQDQPPRQKEAHLFDGCADNKIDIGGAAMGGPTMRRIPLYVDFESFSARQDFQAKGGLTAPYRPAAEPALVHNS